MNTTKEQQPQVGHDQIVHRAKQIWEREGRQAGRDVEYWLRAEREVLRGSNPAGVSEAAPVAAIMTQPAGTTNKAGKGHAANARAIRM